ncbi:MFS transporter [Frondihabitans australicus]|uniref:Putative MFS family arabinose efflux permease n=1 Tax=Frondihabitans australicus TaxID=386892 RepID=A0A495IC64_9MICO|nr:MFS transporter [Frondihabitans australicus]RKR73604.1 putative MFS family arabinose efflux permease [Frondihabitans australicus]
MSTTASDDFSLRRIALGAFGPSVLYGFSQGALLPVVAVSAIDRGASEALASLIVSVLGLGSLVTNIPSGVIATKFGERRAMIGASVLSAIGLALCLLPLGLVVFTLGIALVGAASSVFILARQSYLTQVVPAHMRARALSTLGGSTRIGTFLGPFVAAGAIGLWGIDGAYTVALVTIVGAGFIAYVVPDLVEDRTPIPGAAKATTIGMLQRYWKLFLTLGIGILLLSAIRSTRQVVIPLWAVHIGLSATESSIIYGIAGVVDAAIFYPAGFVMDRYGRKWIAIPCCLTMGVAMVLMPLTHGFVLLTLVSVLMGFGNGIGSGIVQTLGSDMSPAVGRPTFLGLWRELSDGGAFVGPAILSLFTGIIGLAGGIVVSGFVGFAGAAAMARWIPKRDPHPKVTRS